jgi:hypothetical protein
MLGSGKTGRVRASATAATAATASPARSRDIYQRYAVALYRQALLTLDDSAPAEHVVGDVGANEYVPAPGPGRGEDDARYHLAESVLLRCHRLVAGSARQARRPGLFGGLGSIRASRVLGIHQRDMAVLLRTVLRRLTTSPAAAVEDGDQAGGAAPGRR